MKNQTTQRPCPSPAEIAEALLTQDVYLTISRAAAAVEPLSPRLQDELIRRAARPPMTAAAHNAHPDGRYS